MPALPRPCGAALKLYADQLFTTYLLPVQVMGFLLLIAMLGVIVLSKKIRRPGGHQMSDRRGLCNALSSIL